MKLQMTFIFLLVSQLIYSQKFIAVDNFGKNRRKIYVGDYIHFQLKGSDVLYHDEVHDIRDSTFILFKSKTAISINELQKIKFPRDIPKIIGGGFALIGTGFLLSGLTSRSEENKYVKDVTLLYSLGCYTISSVTLLFWWKTYKFGKNAQVQILDTSIKKPIH